ncbi:MAG: hypothetical protein DRH37_07765 [Deltaproteobacteria bacterium]|nr:MAG: hypothetical protein DRH37_07765 [Deltaproteobacteria bacterium]
MSCTALSLYAKDIPEPAWIGRCGKKTNIIFLYERSICYMPIQRPVLSPDRPSRRVGTDCEKLYHILDVKNYHNMVFIYMFSP